MSNRPKPNNARMNPMARTQRLERLVGAQQSTIEGMGRSLISLSQVVQILADKLDEHGILDKAAIPGELTKIKEDGEQLVT